MESTLHIHRIFRLEYYLFPFKIWIDGKKMAEVYPDEEIKIPLTTGKHTVQARIFYHRSKPLEIEVNSENQYIILNFNDTSNNPIIRYFQLYRRNSLSMKAYDHKSYLQTIEKGNRENGVYYIRKGHALLQLLQWTSITFALMLVATSLFYSNPSFYSDGHREWLFFWGGMGLISSTIYFNLKLKLARTKQHLLIRLGAEISIYLIMAVTLWDFPFIRYITLFMALSMVPYLLLILKVFKEGEEVVYG